jgi:hypothetical protein
VADRRAIWKTVRTRVLPVVMVVLLALVAIDTCETATAEIELRFDLGDQAALVEALEADVYAPDAAAPVAYFRDPAPAAAVLRWKVALDPGPYRLLITVHTGAGASRLERQIEATSRAVITVPLAGAVREAAAGATAPDAAGR